MVSDISAPLRSYVIFTLRLKPHTHVDSYRVYKLSGSSSKPRQSLSDGVCVPLISTVLKTPHAYTTRHQIVLTSRFPRSGRLRLSKPTWHNASTSCRTYRYPAEKALLYADRDMAVINKNSGILVQLTSPHARETVRCLWFVMVCHRVRLMASQSSVSAKMFWQLLDGLY